MSRANRSSIIDGGQRAAAHAGNAQPAGIREGILKACIATRLPKRKTRSLRAQLLGSGAIMFEVLKAQAILEKDYGVAADVWSVTSYKELYRDANDCARWNMLHPTQAAKVPYVTKTLKGASGPFIAASDYMKVLPESIAQWIPGKLVSLGTDGFGAARIAHRCGIFLKWTPSILCSPRCTRWLGKNPATEDGAEAVSAKVLERAIRDLGIDPEKRNRQPAKLDCHPERSEGPVVTRGWQEAGPSLRSG